jgi:hypothetical protein
MTFKQHSFKYPVHSGGGTKWFTTFLRCSGEQNWDTVYGYSIHDVEHALATDNRRRN